MKTVSSKRWLYLHQYPYPLSFWVALLTLHTGKGIDVSITKKIITEVSYSVYNNTISIFILQPPLTLTRCFL